MCVTNIPNITSWCGVETGGGGLGDWCGAELMQARLGWASSVQCLISSDDQCQTPL